MLGIFSGVGAALAYTSIRELRRYYDTRAIVMSFMGVGTVAPLILHGYHPYIDTPEGVGTFLILRNFVGTNRYWSGFLFNFLLGVILG